MKISRNPKNLRLGPTAPHKHRGYKNGAFGSDPLMLYLTRVEKTNKKVKKAA